MRARSLFGVLVLVVAVEARGAGLLVPDDVKLPPLAMVHHKVNVTIEDQVAITTVFTGQQILSQQFGSTATTSGLPIPEGKMAVSVQLGDPERVAGFVQPGSEVAVFAVTQEIGGDLRTSQVLLPRVQVIAAGPSTVVSQTSTDASGNENTEEIPKAILTLAVLVYVWSWNEFLLPLVIAAGGVVTTAPVNVGLFTGQYTADIPGQAAAAVILSVPILLLYIVLQRHFIRGVLAGSVKG